MDEADGIRGASFKGYGKRGRRRWNRSSQAVQMRIELACFNLADKNPELAGLDSLTDRTYPPPVGCTQRGHKQRIGLTTMAPITQDEIFKKVQDVLVDALGVDAG